MKSKIIFLLLFLLILFDPLLLNISFSFIKITLLRILLLGILYIFILSHLNRNKLYMHYKIKNWLCFFWFWLAYMIASLFWSPNIENNFQAIYYFILFFILIYSTIKLLNDPKKARFSLNVFYWMVILLTVIGVVEYFTGAHLPTSRYTDPNFVNSIIGNSALNPVTATFYNENDYSLFLSMGIPFILIRIMKGNIPIKLISIVSFILILFLIVKNDAKLILISIFIQLVVFILLLNISKTKKVVSFVFLLLLMISALITDEYILNSLYNAGSSLANNNDIRLNLIRNGFYVLYESHFLGVGVRNFGFFMNPNLDTGNIINPHNWWIELLSEHGVFIFVGYLFLFVWVLINLIRAYRNKSEVKEVALVIFISLIGIITGSFAPSNMFYFWPLWLLLGMALATINLYFFEIKHK